MHRRYIVLINRLSPAEKRLWVDGLESCTTALHKRLSGQTYQMGGTLLVGGELKDATNGRFPHEDCNSLWDGLNLAVPLAVPHGTFIDILASDVPRRARLFAAQSEADIAAQLEEMATHLATNARKTPESGRKMLKWAKIGVTVSVAGVGATVVTAGGPVGAALAAMLL